jgi:hypothetical protein
MKYDSTQIAGAEMTAWYAPCKWTLDMTPCVEWDRTPFGNHMATTPLTGHKDPHGRPRDHKGCEGTVAPAKVIIEFKEGETKLLPKEWDTAIQQVVCNDCRDRKMYCKDPSHANKVVTGGLGMMLRKIEGYQPPVHPSCLPDQEQGAAVTHPARATEHVTLDERTMARAKGLKK